MVSIVDAATTISPALVSRPLITAMVMIGCMCIFLYFDLYETCCLFIDPPLSVDIVSLVCLCRLDLSLRNCD